MAHPVALILVIIVGPAITTVLEQFLGKVSLIQKLAYMMLGTLLAVCA